MFRKTQSKIWNRIIRSRTAQPILSRFGPSGEHKLWIFILGNYNSGTTLLYELLRKQTGISSLPWEGSRLTHHFTDPNDYGWPRMWHACAEEMKGAESGLGKKEARHIKRQWNWSSNSTSKVFVEKSITNATRIPFLAKNFNPAFFIHIVRNPYASCEGIQRKATPNRQLTGTDFSSYPMSMCAQQWIESNQLIEAHLTESKSIQITYEDLCADPQKTIDNISTACPELSELGIRFETHEKIRVHGSSGLISNQNEDAISRLSEKDRSEITNVASKMMNHYGYSVIK